ncbi:MAG: geranylgeranyl diphosphate reductase [Beijerinckiaceae bacterium]|jgi:geranylgeranyl reductase|nr:geranylgeranyl diphosphate reductase [Beijerinckiaceae bacterium]
MTEPETFDVVVVGGGPAGATAAADLAAKGHSVLLLDKAGRIKPCGGAIPPRLIRDFRIPDELLCAKISSARMIPPSGKAVDMPIDNGGYVGMVNRETFDEWLRVRAGQQGAERRRGQFERLSRAPDGVSVVHYTPRSAADPAGKQEELQVRARIVIGADGAVSGVARAAIPGADKIPFVFAYHEIVRAPADGPSYDSKRCDVHYDGRFSPDFYSWVFPHGDTMSIGTGSANKGFSLRGSVADLRRHLALDEAATIRKEGAPIPLKPLKKWDNGRDVIVIGDAAGVVAPSSGEGIYYAMACARHAADAVHQALVSGDARALAGARKAFMKAHGRVFWILGVMQWVWYRNDRLRERFVAICKDKDVQRLTWESYMNKELVRSDPMAHVRIFFKDLGHLLGVART